MEARDEGRRRLQKPLGQSRRPQEPPPYADLGGTFLTVSGEHDEVSRTDVFTYCSLKLPHCILSYLYEGEP